MDSLSPFLSLSFSFRICAAVRPLCSLFRSHSDRFVEAGPPKLCTGVCLLSLPNGFPPAQTHPHMCTHSLSTCWPIFLLAHRLLSLDTDACSVRRECHRITMHPFPEQTVSHPRLPPLRGSKLLLLPVGATMTKHFNKTSPPGTVVQSGYQEM